ncbi:S-layer family protein [Planktothricoides raciborskii]|uniref:S-layer family protein n=1 Tax=Planktothricoides raciborskii GIHE-MW2 TaxID=2792601 RepID=A0AAU8JIB5_9CYAN
MSLFSPLQSSTRERLQWSLGTLVSSLASSLSLWLVPIPQISAQVIPDGSLPNNSIVTPDGNTTVITGGTTTGSYLFHSFEQFSLSTGNTAFFNNGLTISNIITRVTGGSISNIDGIIRANGTANLFLLNPNGIVFGPNASLNIGGSFLGTTASRITFADGSEFSATDPNAPPLLTVNVPIGLQFDSSAGSIQVQGPGHGVIPDPETRQPNRDARPAGLQVNPGKTLAFLGGDVSVTGGNITAEAGRVEVWSVSNGELSVNIDGSNLQVNHQTGTEFKDINFTQAASIDTSGNRSGEIQMQGRQIRFADGSLILALNLGNQDGGNIAIRGTESVELTGISPENFVPSSFLAEVMPEATGSGSNLSIETGRLVATDGGQVSTLTVGFGNAGDLTIKAKSVEVIGGSEFTGPSGFVSSSDGQGNGGNLIIETDSLLVAYGAQIASNTFGSGDSGDVTVIANDFVEIIGESVQGTSALSAAASSGKGAASSGKGNGGNLTIHTNSLRVADGGQIAASTAGQGNAGNLTIDAQEIELVGRGYLSRSGLFASAILPESPDSSPDSENPIQGGNGGDIEITTDKLTVRDGAIISVSNFPSSLLLNALPGTGAAGNIMINAGSRVLLDNDGLITADTQQGNNANIIVNARDIQLRQASKITTNSTQLANGGNITLTMDNLVGLENSDITANAEVLDGGKVIINAEALFGIAFRQELTLDSDITATGGSEGVAGTVEINTPDVDPAAGLISLSGSVIDVTALVGKDLCSPEILANSSFTITGRGGIPPTPMELFGFEPIALEWARPNGTLSSQSGLSYWSSSLPVNASRRTGGNSQPISPILEAQGWTEKADGTIVLTAQSSTVTPNVSGFTHPGCR